MASRVLALSLNFVIAAWLMIAIPLVIYVSWTILSEEREKRKKERLLPTVKEEWFECCLRPIKQFCRMQLHKLSQFLHVWVPACCPSWTSYRKYLEKSTSTMIKLLWLSPQLFITQVISRCLDASTTEISQSTRYSFFQQESLCLRFARQACEMFHFSLTSSFHLFSLLLLTRFSPFRNHYSARVNKYSSEDSFSCITFRSSI